MIDVPLTVTDAGTNQAGDPLDLITWDARAEGAYRLRVDGKWVSSSFDGTKTSWKVKRGKAYELYAWPPQDALGVYPPVTPPPPPPPPSGVAPPVGPFTVLDGNYGSAANPAAFVRTTSSTTIKKLNVKRYTGYGIGAMQYYPPTVQNPGRTTVEDCIAEEITSNPPGSMDGTGEAGFWFGNPTDAKRLIARNCGWMGMWTGSKASGSIIEDFQIEQARGVGLYVEHVTSNSVFRRFKIKSAGNGINIEWWYGGEGSSNLLFEDGDIYCPPNLDYRSAGVFADAGTFGCTFRRIRFWGPGNAIGLPNKLVDPSKPNKVEDCVFENSGQKVYYHNNNIG